MDRRNKGSDGDDKETKANPSLPKISGERSPTGPPPLPEPQPRGLPPLRRRIIENPARRDSQTLGPTAKRGSVPSISPQRRAPSPEEGKLGVTPPSPNLSPLDVGPRRPNQLTPLDLNSESPTPSPAADAKRRNFSRHRNWASKDSLGSGSGDHPSSPANRGSLALPSSPLAAPAKRGSLTTHSPSRQNTGGVSPSARSISPDKRGSLAGGRLPRSPTAEFKAPSPLGRRDSSMAPHIISLNKLLPKHGAKWVIDEKLEEEKDKLAEKRLLETSLGLDEEKLRQERGLSELEGKTLKALIKGTMMSMSTALATTKDNNFRLENVVQCAKAGLTLQQMLDYKNQGITLPDAVRSAKAGLSLQQVLDYKNSNICPEDAALWVRAGQGLQEARECLQNGITLVDALNYKRIVREQGCSIELRGGSPVQCMDERVARKFFDIKEKSEKGEGFTHGFIKVAQLKDPTEAVERMKDSGIHEDVYHIPLGKILTLKNEDGTPRYQIDSVDQGHLRFKLTKDTAAAPALYCINLDENDYRIKKDTSKWKDNLAAAKASDFPGWPPGYDFERMKNLCFPAKHPDGTGGYVDDKILVARAPDTSFIPIATDNDANSVSCPVEKILQRMSPEQLHLVTQRIHASDRSGAGELIHARLELEGFFEKLLRNPEFKEFSREEVHDKRAQIAQEEKAFSRETGWITGWVAFIRSLVNGNAVKDASKEFMRWPWQHSDEANNLLMPQVIKATPSFDPPDGKLRVAPNLESLVAQRISTLREQYHPVNEKAHEFPTWLPYLAMQINYQDATGKPVLPVTDSQKRAFIDCVLGENGLKVPETLSKTCADQGLKQDLTAELRKTCEILAKDSKFCERAGITDTQRDSLKTLASSEHKEEKESVSTPRARA